MSKDPKSIQNPMKKIVKLFRIPMKNNTLNVFRIPMKNNLKVFRILMKKSVKVFRIP
jgi:hypothetical protein